MTIPDLHLDVLYEIFLHFVAIDWDGPYTLMMVCAKWSDIVLSQARLWTWVMLDESQPDWKERIHVAQELSRNMPSQMVLRIPCLNLDYMLDSLPRCEAVFLDTSTRTSVIQTASNYDEWTLTSSASEDLHGVVTLALTSLSCRQIKAFVESADGACYSYSTWIIYERLWKVKTLQGQTNDLPTILITTLILKDKPRKNPRRMRILNIWPYLPAMHHLYHLALSDNFVGVDRPSTAALIQLSTLKHLTIESVDTANRNDIFELLPRLHAPMLREMVLRGSFYRIVTAVGRVNDAINPSDLTLSFSIIEKGSWRMQISRQPIWHALKRITLDLSELVDPNSSVHIEAPANFTETINWLLLYPPHNCTVRLCGGPGLADITDSRLLLIRELEIVCTTRVSPKFRSDPPRIKLLIARADWLPSYWLNNAEHVVIENNECLKNILASGSTPNILILDCTVCSLRSEALPWPLDLSSQFDCLTILRCVPDVASRLFMLFRMSSLRVLILTRLEGGLPQLLSSLSRRTIVPVPLTYLPLTALYMEEFPPGSIVVMLLQQLRNFGGGIQTLGLPGLPHPSILQLLIRALNGDWSMPQSRFRGFTEGGYNPDERLGCQDCFRAGWACYEKGKCRRFSPSNMVYITKNTVVGDYSFE